MSTNNEETFVLSAEEELTASGVLAEAENKSSPFHELFEWDDSKAAHEYRLIQAQIIIDAANEVMEETD